MADSMNSSIDTLKSILKERAESGMMFEAFDTYQRVTMDVITRTAFGIRTDVQTNLKSKLLKATKLIFHTNYRDPVIFIGRKYLMKIARNVFEGKYVRTFCFVYMSPLFCAIYVYKIGC